MKKFALGGFIVALLVFGFALYVQFMVVPSAEVAEAQMLDYELSFVSEGSTSVFSKPEYQQLLETFELKVTYSIYLFFAAIFSFLLCIYPAIKKNGLSILGLILSLVSFFIGAVYGTHMFS